MKLKLFVLGCFAVLLTGIWSCGPGENAVTIEVLSSNEFPERGDDVTLTVRATSDKRDLSEVAIVVTTVDSMGTEIEVLNDKADASGLSFENDFTITTPAGVGIGEKINIVITAKDEDGDSYDENTDIEAVAYMKLFRGDAVFGHRFGALAIGYNLVEGTEVYVDAPAATKDIVDNSEQGKELGSVLISNPESGTQFVDLGGSYVIDDLNTGVAAKRFAEATSGTLVTVIEGTKVLAKLRDNSYALVHIKTLEPEYAHQGATDNLGRYVIDIYKPKP